MKSFILAARPKTLLAGVLPPFVAYAYFLSTHRINASFYLMACVSGALFIQLATNFFNDVIDYEKGADAERIGPTRVSASGLVEIATVRKWAYICLLLGGLWGIPIIIRGGWPFLVLGLISLALTYGYTGGKISLAYRGLGELFVFLFFGLFSVLGSYYLFALELDLGSFVLACIFGLLTTTLIAFNNLRDRDLDAKVGKLTLATKMPVRAYQVLVLATIFGPYLLLLYFWEMKMISAVYLGLVPATKLVAILFLKRGTELNLGLKYGGIHLVVFSLLLGFTFIYGNIF